MNRTLTLLRGPFARAHPVQRGGRPDWVPRSGFVLIMDSRDDYWILCAEDAIPPEVPRISDLAVFHLQPDGFMIVEIMRAIEPHLRGIHMEATSIFKSDTGVLV